MSICTDLNKTRILYRDRNCQLWGIPYLMRDDVGQTPRHLQEAQKSFEEQRAEAFRTGGLGAPIGNPMEGWLWLGSPGWLGTMSRQDQEDVKVFLAMCVRVPGNIYEWCEVEKKP